MNETAKLLIEKELRIPDKYCKQSSRNDRAEAIVSKQWLRYVNTVCIALPCTVLQQLYCLLYHAPTVLPYHGPSGMSLNAMRTSRINPDPEKYWMSALYSRQILKQRRITEFTLHDKLSEDEVCCLFKQGEHFGPGWKKVIITVCLISLCPLCALRVFKNVSRNSSGLWLEQGWPSQNR